MSKNTLKDLPECFDCGRPNVLFVCPCCCEDTDIQDTKFVEDDLMEGFSLEDLKVMLTHEDWN